MGRRSASPGLEIRTWKVWTYQGIEHAGLGEIPKRASTDGLGLSPEAPTQRGFRMKEEMPKEMEKECVKREGKPTECGVGPGSQAKNMLAGGESEQLCEVLLMGPVRWQPLWH